MKNLIEILMDDHQQIAKVIDHIENLKFLRDINQKKDVLEWLKSFNAFKELIVLHHKKEEKVLYNWMIEQNKNADKVLINVIINEHKSIDELLERIDESYSGEINFLELRTMLVQLIDAYHSHMTKEEKFIFVIAQSLKNTASKEKELLKNLSELSVKDSSR